MTTLTHDDIALLDHAVRYFESEGQPALDDLPSWLKLASVRDVAHRIHARLDTPPRGLSFEGQEQFTEELRNFIAIGGLSFEEFEQFVTNLKPAERAQLYGILKNDPVPFVPQAGAQDWAYNSPATVIGYGGSVGSGKTGLGVGISLTKHREVAVFRRIGTELHHVLDQFEHALGDRKGYNANDRLWRLPNLQIIFGSCPNPGDEHSHQGRPKDLIVFDEVQAFLESQVQFISTWLRSTYPGQPCRILMTMNPPDMPEALWLYDFFAPWIGPDYKGTRAKFGELRWFFRDLKQRDTETDHDKPFFYEPEQRMVYPQSRTFIPGALRDNKFLPPEYMSAVAANPDSQRLLGDFAASSLFKDHPQQLFPSELVEQAMQRGKELGDPDTLGEIKWYGREPRKEMVALGLDVAYGGKDRTVGVPRYTGNHYGKPHIVEGKHTPDGRSAANVAIALVRDGAPILVDGIGYGAACVEALRFLKQNVYAINVGEGATELDQTSTFEFWNLRTQLLWQLREKLLAGDLILPYDPALKREMLVVRYYTQGKRPRVEGRDEIIKRLGRSPDILSALMLASIDKPKVYIRPNNKSRVPQSPWGGHDPYSREMLER